jgi:thioredoxin 1
MSTLLFIVALFGILLGLQKLQTLRMTRKKGKPAPRLSGVYGEALDSGKPTLFYFYSPGCGACRSMTPIVSEYVEEGSRCFKVDVSRDMATAQAFGVMGTPSTVVVENGVIRDFFVGPRPEAALTPLLEEARH